jgi:hypothetical protein
MSIDAEVNSHRGRDDSQQMISNTAFQYSQFEISTFATDSHWHLLYIGQLDLRNRSPEDGLRYGHRGFLRQRSAKVLQCRVSFCYVRDLVRALFPRVVLHHVDRQEFEFWSVH